MKVVILCGGEGVRFRNNVSDVPKVLAPIGGQPILWHIMKYYSSYGHNEFVLCLGNNQPEIRAFVDSLEEDWIIHPVDTGSSTPTGGRVKRVESFIEEKDFLVTYGDGVSDVNLNELVDYHNKHQRIATITAVQPYSQYGLMELDDQGRVNNFIEKPKMNKYVNGGFFVFNSRIFNFLEEWETLETSLFTKLVETGELMAYKHQGFWKSMDTFKENQQLNEIWQAKSAPWLRW